LLKKEKKFYHKDIGVMFQQKAWADRDFCLNWAKDYLKPHLRDHTDVKATKLLI